VLNKKVHVLVFYTLSSQLVLKMYEVLILLAVMQMTLSCKWAE